MQPHGSVVPFTSAVATSVTTARRLAPTGRPHRRKPGRCHDGRMTHVYQLTLTPAGVRIRFVTFWEAVSMSVKLRLSRVGAKKNPFYRVVVTDSRSPRDGKFIEHVGIYDPNRDPVEIRFDMERVKHWLSVGATPSDTVSELLAGRREGPGRRRQGVARPSDDHPSCRS